MSHKKSLQVFRISFALASLVTLQAGGSACAARPPSQKTDTLSVGLLGPDQSFLTQSIQDDLTGFPLESAETRERLQTMAQGYVEFKKAKPSSNLRKLRIRACLDDEPQDAYEASICRLVLKSSGGQRKSSKHSSSASRASRIKRVRQLVRDMKDSRLEAFATASDTEILDAMKKISGIEPFRPLIAKALDPASCAPTSLLTGLGQKTEEFFPDPAYKTLAKSLYQRASECGTDSAAVKASYRLGLIQVWDEKYDLAELSFARIMDNSEAVDFRSRIVYWRHFCAKQMGNIILLEKMRLVLAKDYNLSLHGLITLGASDTGNQPRIAFNSQLAPQLNASVRLAEALQTVGARDASVDVLVPILDQLKSAEPEFQLYVGLMFTRAGDTLNKFKLLTGLLRDYPAFISQGSLEMLFPLERFAVIRGHEKKADPYLVISLIRQESAFNERARSPVGARGLMQLMPRTAQRMERVSRNALFDPHTNIRLGVRFFSHLTARYQGETEMALAAYNAGPQKVDTWRLRYPVENRLLFVDLIPYRETREYVASIARNYYWYKKLYFEAQNTADDVAAAAAGKIRSPSSEKAPIFKIF